MKMNKYDEQKRNVEVQKTILGFLFHERKPFTVKGLSQKFGFPYTSVNHVIAGLRDGGYVTREIDDQSGRTGRPRYLYYITKDPKKLEKLQNFLERSSVETPEISQRVRSKDPSPEENVALFEKIVNRIED